MQHWSLRLSYKPCADAVAWLLTQPDAQTAWNICQRGNWMLFHAGKCDRSEPYSAERRKITAAACACARLAWERMPKKSRAALVLFERWASGEDIAINDLREARSAAADAADDAPYGYAAAAAAAAAATTADAAAYAATAAAAADATADAAFVTAAAATAAAAAATAARVETLARCARIVRQHYPVVPR